MRHCLLPCLLIAALVQLSGCAAYRNYDLELEQTTQQLKAGNIDGSLALIEAHNPGEEKDLLYYFEKGAVLSAGGELPQSQVAWRSAEQMVIQRQDTIETTGDKLLAAMGNQWGSIINDKLRRYDGYDYEKVMLTTQMALNQLAMNDFDGARADIKKTHEREALIARQRELEYERVEEAAKANGARVHYKDLQGYPVVMLDSPAVIALKNGYQSAFSHYLAGFTYEALGRKRPGGAGLSSSDRVAPGHGVFPTGLARSRQPWTEGRRKRCADHRAERTGAGPQLRARALPGEARGRASHRRQFSFPGDGSRHLDPGIQSGGYRWSSEKADRRQQHYRHVLAHPA